MSSGWSLVLGLIRTARPKQWLKNVLVFAAPAAAGLLDDGSVLGASLVAFAAFCLAASGTYFLNDAHDVDSDRRHPTKRTRPMAAGVFGPTTGSVIGAVLIVASVVVAVLGARWQLALVVGIYVVNTTAYSLLLKHRAIFDIMSVAAGFLLRAVGGAAATNIPLSNWFLSVASFGSLFIVVSKRYSEYRAFAEDPSGPVRVVLNVYNAAYLQYLRSVSTAAVLVSYCLFAFEKSASSTVSFPWYQLSVVPFVGAILKYSLLTESGHGEAPEDLLLSNRILVLAGVAWLGLFLGGTYALG